jgi:hypothetical protein
VFSYEAPLLKEGLAISLGSLIGMASLVLAATFRVRNHQVTKGTKRHEGQSVRR